MITALVASLLSAVLPAPSRAADETYYEIGSWNGKKIYLSPATHTDSGTRGECGQYENTNGYQAAYYAAKGSYWTDVWNPSYSENNLLERHYRVRIGRDSNDIKIANSNAWGATLHIPIHSNARGGTKVPTARSALRAGAEGLTRATLELRTSMERQMIRRHKDLLVLADRYNYAPDGRRR